MEKSKVLFSCFQGYKFCTASYELKGALLDFAKSSFFFFSRLTHCIFFTFFSPTSCCERFLLGLPILGSKTSILVSYSNVENLFRLSLTPLIISSILSLFAHEGSLKIFFSCTPYRKSGYSFAFFLN